LRLYGSRTDECNKDEKQCKRRYNSSHIVKVVFCVIIDRQRLDSRCCLF
jgi:hypothetical protein